jgi:polyhydroxyalkanoate synthesis regulator phasin
MKRLPFLMLLPAFFLGMAVTSITQEQPQRRWRQQDIEDAIAMNLMQEVAPGEFGADLPVTRGELARILVEARPYLRAVAVTPSAPLPGAAGNQQAPAGLARPAQPAAVRGLAGPPVRPAQNASEWTRTNPLAAELSGDVERLSRRVDTIYNDLRSNYSPNTTASRMESTQRGVDEVARRVSVLESKVRTISKDLKLQFSGSGTVYAPRIQSMGDSVSGLSDRVNDLASSASSNATRLSDLRRSVDSLSRRVDDLQRQMR